ncbi:MAG: DUF1631 family protein [Pseudomonadota bacterium]|nr:DUF1631 family protein [Pseudomonadota bacterium]
MSVKVVDHPSKDGLPSAALLARSRDIIVERLAAILEDLLLALDDELFALAESARSDRAQQQFFDTMRALRLGREAIRDDFRSRLHEPTPNEMRPSEPSQGSSTPLSLLENDALEQRIAETTMSQRIEREHELRLTLLRARIRRLHSQSDARALVVPIEPLHVAHGFVAAMRSLELDKDVRLIIYKRFEQEALLQLGAVFDDLNEMLADAGVLPDLTAAQAAARPQTRRRPASQSAASRPAAPPPAAAIPPVSFRDPAGERIATGPGTFDAALAFAFEGFDAQQLAEELGALPGLQRLRRYGPVPGAQTLVSRMLMDVAVAAQGHIAPRLEEAGLDVVPARIDFGELLRHSVLQEGQSVALNGTDEDVVNLVQALFDRLLADDNLPVPMRALLARIQFPILRIALSDAGFLAGAAHPARRFLNLITRLGIGWTHADERMKDRLYQLIEGCVDAFARADALDTETIKGFNETIEQALIAEADRLERASERAIKQERARLEAEKTRALVERLVTHRCARITAGELRQFLMDEWQQVMFKVHQREGRRSAAWKRAFSVLRSLTGNVDLEDSALQSALSEGLRCLGLSEAEASERAARALDLLLEAVERKDEEQSAPIPADTQVEPGIESLPDRNAMDQANRLAVGEWIEMDRQSDTTLRCRLATVTDPPERCIFLNRHGVRVETLSRLELAAAIQDGRLRSINSDQIFDNTLASVIGGLRGATASPPT